MCPWSIHVNAPSIVFDAVSLRTKGQLRGARAILGWSQEELARASGVSLPTIKRLEPGDGALQVRLDTLSRIEKALSEAGIEFVPGGARLREQPAGAKAS